MKLLDIVNEFTVRDIDKSIEFYKKYFDFEVEEVVENQLHGLK